MDGDRAPQVGTAVATLWLAGVVVLDVATPRPTFVLAPLFALAPLIACAVLPVRRTAVFAALAIVMAICSGWWDHAWGTAQQTVRVVDVVLVSTASVVIAAVRVRRERQHARVVAIAEIAQRAVLPKLPRLVGRVAAGARYESAAQDAVVGGDLYDCYYTNDQVRFLVGDVRGKGIGAVEQAARVIRAFRQAAARDTTLPEVAQDMSSYLVPFFGDEEFATALLVDASDPTRLTLVSCGHPPAMLVHRGGSPEFLEAPPGLPLGLGDTYDALTVPWATGDRLLMYTDGLSEARNTDGEFLLLPPLASRLTADNIEDALDQVVSAVGQHVPGSELADDLAVVLLENLAANQELRGGSGPQLENSRSTAQTAR